MFRLIVLGVLLINTGCFFTKKECSSSHYKVYYIDLDTDFYMPPLPLEKLAEKIFDINLDEDYGLFKNLKKENKLEKNNEALARIKLVDQGCFESITIDQSKKVIKNGYAYKVNQDQLNEVLRIIKIQADLIFDESASYPGHSYFHLGNSKISKENQEMLKKINEDMNAVVYGTKPRHAKFDSSLVPPLDGGTTYYIGDGYRLTVLKQLIRVGEIDGVVYGPEVSVEQGKLKLSRTKFYTYDELKKILKDEVK